MIIFHFDTYNYACNREESRHTNFESASFIIEKENLSRIKLNVEHLKLL